MPSNTRCSGLSRQRGYSTSRMASAFSRSKPIENVWDALGRQVAGRNYPPTNKNTLIRALTEEWDKLPQQLLDNIVQNESRFSLECDTRHVLVWRDRGPRNNPAFVRERSQYRRAGWMVWSGISIGGRTDLHIIRNGTLTGRRYADEILRPHVIPYAGAIGDSFVFQDDNARPHRARLVENMLEAETIQRME
ncbi:transposable element Tcb2 transposase [Trichonephila clavipes]|uniref:Transposable element Tcb2 transposase n=1 Tax=Trichonephila clavipes TaxID=2585209 RepID=A0A8X6VWI1_TRICX|nr:transposable element Tcb2 transposase [Trichonephila clavipes]